jgi:anhydro-N-acetylmuramic acid kinase
LDARDASAAELALLGMEVAWFWAGRAKRFLRSAGVSSGKVAVLGSHGQTVVHLPGRASIQIGEPAVLAEALGIPVAADFRPSDIAAGGEGAPLMPFLDHFLFGGGPARAVQNIGGIGNVSLVGLGVKPLGFDTGPGNCLMDAAVAKRTRGRHAFDRGGRLAARGKVRQAAVRKALRHPFFSVRPPRSADRSLFGESFLRPLERACRRTEDLLATLNYLTALSIGEAYDRFVLPRAKVKEVLLSGGGALNPVLVRNLRHVVWPIKVLLPEDYGIPALAKEAACFALMAARRLEGRPNHAPTATGARGERVLGKLVLPPR